MVPAVCLLRPTWDGAIITRGAVAPNIVVGVTGVFELGPAGTGDCSAGSAVITGRRRLTTRVVAPFALRGSTTRVAMLGRGLLTGTTGTPLREIP